MAYWLVKDEPESWSYAMHAKEGVAAWDGVRNHQAAANLRKMKAGERAFFYHSVTEKQVVGVLEVAREAYPDPTDPEGKWVAVDFKAVAPLPRPVTLAAIKADKRLAQLALVRQSRLSVMPVSAAEWAAIARLGGLAK
jgi:predicted RNA-binding protein with PUA-like domain